jgi:hypothetical protein
MVEAGYERLDLLVRNKFVERQEGRGGFRKACRIYGGLKTPKDLSKVR